MPLGLQGHLPNRETQVVQYEQLRQPSESRPASRAPENPIALSPLGGIAGVGVKSSPGGVSERFKVRLSKSRVAATPPRVRISPPPPRHPQAAVRNRRYASRAGGSQRTGSGAIATRRGSPARHAAKAAR